MAGQRFLVPYVRVRLLPPQPFDTALDNVAPSSSGLGRRPLKAEVAGSNPVGATKKFAGQRLIKALTFFVVPDLPQLLVFHHGQFAD